MQTKQITTTQSSPKQSSATINPLFVPSHRRIDRDELLNQYLQQSLSLDIVEQVDNTKNWLKNNKKEGRKVIQVARRELDKVFRSKRMPAKQFISTENKSLNKLILSTSQTKPIPNKIFNETCLDKLLQQKNSCQLKNSMNSVSQMRNVQNYLHQLSKLETLTKGERATTKQYHNFHEFSVNKQCLSSRDYFVDDDRSEKSERDRFNSQKTHLQFRLTAMNRTNGWKSLFSNRVLKQNYKVSKGNFHPFLEKTSNMFYEPKKRNNKNWKFQIVRHRAGIYI